MTMHFNIGEAKTRLSELVAAAMRGEDIVLDKAGNPQVMLVPVGDSRLRSHEEVVAQRRAAFGMFADKYRHLHGTGALDVPPSMTDDELEERLRRKFGTPSA